MSMNNTEHNFIQKLKKTRLTEGVRLRIREELVAYAELHTMPAVEAAPFNTLTFLGSVIGHSRTLAVSVLALAIIVGSGTATAFAAENAVPGEPLYAVKTRVNEPARAVFAGSVESKARLHSFLALRRVQEAEVLRERGTLSAKTEAELASRFEGEADKALHEADKLEESGDASESLAIRANLEAQLSAQAGQEHDTNIRQAVVRKVARLREGTAEAPAVQSAKKGAKMSEKARVRATSLLTGTSVSGEEASTTATSTPVVGKRLLETLIHERENQKKEDARMPIESSAGVPIPVAVPNPSRLVPPVNSLLR